MSIRGLEKSNPLSSNQLGTFMTLTSKINQTEGPNFTNSPSQDYAYQQSGYNKLLSKSGSVQCGVWDVNHSNLFWTSLNVV